jgi:membrane-bound lytic murein transglycosylase D
MNPKRPNPSLIVLFLVHLVLIAACAHPKPPRAVPAPAPQPAAVQPPAAEASRPAAETPAVAPEPASKPAQDDKEASQAVKPEADEKDPSVLLEAAYAAVEAGQAAIDAQDMDGAMARLDEAYGYLLRMAVTADSPLFQEKQDLRLLIAQRIQKVAAPRLNLASVNGSIPLVDNQWVQREVKSFQTVERDAFVDAYKRSGQYREMILEELRKEHLPEQLSWIPLIESAFRPRALSRARALGMWQFIRSTGYRYGLKQDKYVDERMDPLKATRAAIQYMMELHDMFGDWTSAIAAYNCGEAQVQKVIRYQKVQYFDSFWDIFANLPFETARHVPRFIATLLIVGDPAKYGFDLPTPDPPLQVETVRIDAAVRLATLAQNLGLDAATLVALNSELRHDSTPNYGYDLKVPAGYGEKCLACIASLPRYIPPDVVTDRYKVRPGDNLGAIARRYRTSVDAIKRLNGLRSNLIRIGQVLRVPSRGGVETSPAAAAANAGAGETVTYTVRSGDTLYQIAQSFKTTVDRIKAANGLSSDILFVGQKLTIEVGKTS